MRRAAPWALFQIAGIGDRIEEKAVVPGVGALGNRDGMPARFEAGSHLHPHIFLRPVQRVILHGAVHLHKKARLIHRIAGGFHIEVAIHVARQIPGEGDVRGRVFQIGGAVHRLNASHRIGVNQQGLRADRVGGVAFLAQDLIPESGHVLFIHRG